MAKTKQQSNAGTAATSTQHPLERQATQNNDDESPADLYSAAVEHAQQSQPELAIQSADALWSKVKDGSSSEKLPALTLRGEILLELGDAREARKCFDRAVELDPDGAMEGAIGAGAEKFMWLAQLSEEGGKQSLAWYERGIAVLQRQVGELEDGSDFGLDQETLLVLRAEKKARLAHALCGVIELYMTDLSWEDNAEERCEQLITHAITVEDETSPEVLQTLASIRLSQDRHDDARAALARSYGSWKDLDADDAAIPDFAARISLARLLMEAGMRLEALAVVERLVDEDDESVEAWYLGGWCQHLVAEDTEAAGRQQGNEGLSGQQAKALGHALRESRKWLTTAVDLYKQLEYEDERLRDHALEILQKLDQALGPADEDAAGTQAEMDSEEDDWLGNGEDHEDHGDHEMHDV